MTRIQYLGDFHEKYLGLCQELLRIINDPGIEIQPHGNTWELHYVYSDDLDHVDSILDAAYEHIRYVWETLELLYNSGTVFTVTPGFYCVPKRPDLISAYDQTMRSMGFK